MFAEGYLVVTGGQLFVQSPFGGLVSGFCLRSAGPGWPRSVAERPAQARSAGDKNRKRAVVGVVFWPFFSCGLRLLLLFAIFQVGFLRGSISQRLVCAPCVVSIEPLSQSLPQIA